MKTSSAHKVNIIKGALRAGNRPQIGLHGSDLRYDVKSMRNVGHSLEIELARHGFLVIDPDEIQLVLVAKIPTRDDA